MWIAAVATDVGAGAAHFTVPAATRVGSIAAWVVGVYAPGTLGCPAVN